ncbi:CMRF35-like molecule 9 isoform 4-T4 [Callospermophilus lateralis]|uniref:CMRF35-like molecule 9 isoform X5 n=1 Tax=Callospermophilus lateralis TaxID=76772 RepID=UPI0040548329
MRPVVLLWSCLMLPDPQVPAPSLDSLIPVVSEPQTRSLSMGQEGFEALKGPKDISGFEGDTVSLKCTYGKEERESKKYWCKQIGFLVSRCSSTIYSGEDGQEITQGRVSICDNPQELAFTVTLRDLTLQDAGKYWCGADKLGFDETFLVSLTVFPGSSRPPMPLDSTLAEDTSPVPISHSSRSRVSIPMVRILAPVLVLLSLLLAAGLIASGSLLLRWRKKAQLALETQKNEKVHLPTLPLGNSWVLEEAVINLSGPTEPLTSLESSASPYKETLCLNQTTEELEAPSLDPMESTVPEPLPLMSEEELGFSKFISV